MIGTNTVDEQMDMAKYRCTILSSYADYEGCPDFPNFEEKWARNMAEDYPYELRFEALANNQVKSVLLIFEDEEAKALFKKDYPDIVEQLKLNK